MKKSFTKNMNHGRTMLVLALATVLTSAVAQSSQDKPVAQPNPLAPAQVAVPAVNSINAVIAPKDPQQAAASYQAPSAPSVSAPPPTAVEADPLAALQQPRPPAQPPQVVQSAAGVAQANGPAVTPSPSQMVTPYTVPPSGPGIFQGSDQTFREISYLTAEVDLIDARTKREEALKKQAEAHGQLVDLAAGKNKVATGGQAGGSNAAQAEPAKLTPEQEKLAAQNKLLEEARKIAETPYVNSVYMYGDKAYAEIVLGSTWVMASNGTQLLNGDKVVSISQSGVVVTGKKGRRTLPVRGSASVN